MPYVQFSKTLAPNSRCSILDDRPVTGYIHERAIGRNLINSRISLSKSSADIPISGTVVRVANDEIIIRDDKNDFYRVKML